MRPSVLVLFLALLCGSCGEDDKKTQSRYFDESRECYGQDAATGDTIRFSLRTGSCQDVEADQFGNPIGTGQALRQREQVRCVSGAETLERDRRDDLFLTTEGPACVIAGLDSATLRFYVDQDTVILGIDRGDSKEKQTAMTCDPVKRRVIESKIEC